MAGLHEPYQKQGPNYTNPPKNRDRVTRTWTELHEPIKTGTEIHKPYQKQRLSLLTLEKIRSELHDLYNNR